MKAVYINKHGGVDVLEYGDVPEPTVDAGQVKVQVKSACLNRLDLYTREGDRGLQREFPPSLILGGDCSGDVVEVGEGVRGLSVGDRVIVYPKMTCGQCVDCLSARDDLCSRSQFLGTASNGSYADYVVVDSGNAHVISDDITYDMAAAVPTTFLPCWNILVRRGKLKSWETLLVLSASAGVGTAAIQLAKNVIGATVLTTTSSEEKAKRATDIGADHVINYKEESIRDRIKEITNGSGVDFVLDHVGADFFKDAFYSLKPGGRYGICGATTGLRAELHLGLLFSKQIDVFGAFMGSKKDMIEITQTLNKGYINPSIHQTFPLANTAEAHKMMEETNFFGKIIINP
ncbi:MAG: zinc-binding dehydrogenase [SAR202 cluster bacterium]|nr:zinc-binding dehydrogenase [SAR202 cluster bacterium]MQG52315.1 zinc-binding dehydrogenase [SAR202 cluster bacterium]|tara:strand:+ start:2635 stop:3672 length:1038 start_codon:yes stop_codon:yes gene_type:complete